jgi:anti-anti-sigma factor
MTGPPGADADLYRSRARNYSTRRMAVSNTNTDSLLFGKDERGYFITARGNIRANLCFPLREGLLARLDKDRGPPAVFADLSQCDYMDSTFIGLMVAIDKRLKNISGGRLHLIRPSPACREILAQIGLLSYLLIEEDTVAFPPRMEEVSPLAGKPGADFILTAHEALMETSDEARNKFRLVKEMLERKLRKEKPPPDTP